MMAYLFFLGLFVGAVLGHVAKSNKSPRGSLKYEGEEAFRRILPKEMRSLSTDEIASMYTLKELEAVLRTLVNVDGQSVCPQLLKDAIWMLRSVEAMDEARDKADKKAKEKP